MASAASPLASRQVGPVPFHPSLFLPRALDWWDDKERIMSDQDEV